MRGQAHATARARRVAHARDGTHFPAEGWKGVGGTPGIPSKPRPAPVSRVPVGRSGPASLCGKRQREGGLRYSRLPLGGSILGSQSRGHACLLRMGTPSPKLELFYPKLPPIGPGGYDGTVHQGSHRKYQEAVKWVKLQKNPNQIYRVPLTCGQDIGWWLPKDPSVRPEVAVPWMRAQRHPQFRSPMTKFLDTMSVSNPLFSLF
ncbi:sperm microtubule inner protein 11 [Tiliqua scincoides]|uniref:sperm microtubule inner protein 11 n=1 Tax=Tiliqua scincoides TaxID=71010 RepID=UPI003463589A